MTLDAARIAIFSGEFGCGKSEIAVNRAVHLAEAGEPTALMDLDVVKAHFRSRQAAERVRNAGVEMIMPVGDLADFELPAINPRVLALFRSSSTRVVVDVGGATEGVRILRALGEYLPSDGASLYLIVNPYRPYSRTPGQIVASHDRIAETAGREIAGIISNPHLGKQTNKRVILRGHKIVMDAARDLGKEVAALVVQSALGREVAEDADGTAGTPVYEIDLYLRPPWEHGKGIKEDSELGEAQDRCRTMQGL